MTLGVEKNNKQKKKRWIM